MCQQNRKNRAQQKWRYRMGNNRFSVIKDKLNKSHDMEVKSLKEQQVEMVERQNQMQHQMQGMQALLKTFITQANANLDMEAIAALLAPTTPRDANSILRSYTSSHNLQNQQIDNLGDEDELHREDDHQEDDLANLEGEEEAYA